MGLKGLVYLSLLTLAGASFAKGKTNLKNGRFLLGVGGGMGFTTSRASEIAGAVITQKMTNPYVLSATLGWRPFDGLYFGVRYEHWLAQQIYTLAGDDRYDTLTLQAVGGEAGIQWGNPRLQYYLIAGVFYPLKTQVVREADVDETYTRDTVPYYYSARFQMTLKFNFWLSFALEGGYRRVDLGNLKNGTTPYISDSSNLDLSGPFGSIGLVLHF